MTLFVIDFEAKIFKNAVLFEEDEFEEEDELEESEPILDKLCSLANCLPILENALC